jgi:hypothetical protein
VTERYVRFEQADGQVVVRRCEHCWGGVGDPVSIAYDPAQPTNLRHLHFHRIASAALIVAGLTFLGVGLWWSRRRSVMARREAEERPYGPV